MKTAAPLKIWATLCPLLQCKLHLWYNTWY